MFRFYSPYYLFLIPIVVSLFFIKNKKNGIRVPSLMKIKKENKKIKKHHIERILMILSLLSLIIALARPKNLSQSVKIKKDGIDIVVALDLSQSMQSTDFKPSRIDKAKILLKEFINKRDNDRISLVIFGGDAYTKVPLTFDHSVIDKILDKLTVNDITSNDRTAIGMGLGVSVNRLKNATAKSKVIILMTDGENNSGEMSPQVAAGIAKEFGIKVYTIGIGAKEILVPTAYGTKSVANTELDENLLKYIAKVTDGEYFRASSEENFKEIFKKIDSLEKTKIESKEFFNEKELYENFLIAGIFFLLIALIFKNIIYIKIP